MIDKQLLKTVKSFRKGLLAGKKVNGMCYIVSTSLQGFLSIMKVESELLEVGILHDGHIWQHYVLKLSDGRILDATAGQFKNPVGEMMPDIYLGERPAWYQPIRNTKHSEVKKKGRRNYISRQ